MAAEVRRCPLRSRASKEEDEETEEEEKQKEEGEEQLLRNSDYSHLADAETCVRICSTLAWLSCSEHMAASRPSEVTVLFMYLLPWAFAGPMRWMACAWANYELGTVRCEAWGLR